MNIIRKLFFWGTPERELCFVFKEGKRGKWRWYLYQDEVLVAESPVKGYISKDIAESNALEIFTNENYAFGPTTVEKYKPK